MINKYKKYIILSAQLPLSITGFLVKFAVAIISFTYLRWVRKGIHMGKRFDTYLDCHEKGYKFEK